MQPITVRLFDLADRFPMNMQMAAAFIAMVPPLFIAGFLMRYMKGGLTMGGVKG
jgi:multiple sugar transport system permease protein